MLYDPVTSTLNMECCYNRCFVNSTPPFISGGTKTSPKVVGAPIRIGKNGPTRESSLCKWLSDNQLDSTLVIVQLVDYRPLALYLGFLLR